MTFPWITEKQRRKSERDQDEARWQALQCSLRIEAVRSRRTMEDILADHAKRNVLRPGKTRLRPAIRQAGKDGGAG